MVKPLHAHFRIEQHHTIGRRLQRSQKSPATAHPFPGVAVRSPAANGAHGRTPRPRCPIPNVVRKRPVLSAMPARASHAVRRAKPHVASSERPPRAINRWYPGSAKTSRASRLRPATTPKTMRNITALAFRVSTVARRRCDTATAGWAVGGIQPHARSPPSDRLAARLRATASHGHRPCALQ